jgi:tRNA(fMet)-specific endonuclease VapC
MLKYLLDTDTVIYTMKTRPRQVKRRFQQHSGRIGISTVTVGELVFGAEHSREVERTNFFIVRQHCAAGAPLDFSPPS